MKIFDYKKLLFKTHSRKLNKAAAFALKKVKRKEVRKGSVLLGQTPEAPKAVWEFKGEVVILHHPTTIMTNYQVAV